jgi:uncharacterized repeat protein (TIGR01451 family)
MKKLSNILTVFLMLVLLGLLGCENTDTYQRYDSQKYNMVEPSYDSGYPSGMARETVIAAPTTTLAVRASSAPVAVSEPSEIRISKVYPAPEFALIQMDKVMPRETRLKKSFDYTIRVTNLTNTTLTNVMITEELSGNFKYVSSEPAAKENAANLVWNIDSLGPRSSEQILVSGRASNIEPVKLTTTVVPHFDPARTVVKVVEPQLELTQTAPEHATMCGMIPLEIVVTNSGTGTARGVKLEVFLSDGLQTSHGNSELSIDVGNLVEKQSRRFSVKLQATDYGKYVSKAEVTASGLEDVSQKAIINVGKPELAIEETGPEKQYVGRPVTYEITVSNESDAPAINTVLKEAVPPDVTSIKATAGAKLLRSRDLVWKLGTLEPETSKKIYVSYVPTRVGTLANKITATAHCVESVTASVETAVAGISGVLLEVIDVEDPVGVGSTTMYEIRVTNQGSAPATGINISCILEDSIQYISSRGATPGEMVGNELRFAPLATLPPKVDAAWRVTVKAVKPEDTLFKATMTTDQLSRPVEENEATHLYR